MASPNPERDAERANEVDAAVNDGKPVMPVVAAWGMDEAKRIIGLVMDEYINDFNRAIRQHPPGLNATAFTSKYDALWQAKLDLDQAKYAQAYRTRFRDDPA